MSHKPLHRVLAALMLLASSSVVGLSGCAAESGYVAVAYAPPYYEDRLHTVYDGVTVYYIDGRWYRRRGNGWVYYRREPEALYRYRVHVEHAPLAYRGRRYHHHHDRNYHHARERHEHERYERGEYGRRGRHEHPHGRRREGAAEAPRAMRVE